MVGRSGNMYYVQLTGNDTFSCSLDGVVDYSILYLSVELFLKYSAERLNVK